MFGHSLSYSINRNLEETLRLTKLGLYKGTQVQFYHKHTFMFRLFSHVSREAYRPIFLMTAPLTIVPSRPYFEARTRSDNFFEAPFRPDKPNLPSD